MAWSSLAALTNRATRERFGQAVLYTPTSTGVAVPITAIFDAAAVTVSMQGNVPVQSTAPVLTVVLADLPVAPAARDTVVIDGVTRAVVRIERDGQGGAKFYLAKAER